MDEEVEAALEVEPMLHDRWSLLVFAAAAATEAAQLITSQMTTLTVMAAQHAKQKHYDKKFKEIIR